MQEGDVSAAVTGAHQEIARVAVEASPVRGAAKMYAARNRGSVQGRAIPGPRIVPAGLT